MSSESPRWGATSQNLRLIPILPLPGLPTLRYAIGMDPSRDKTLCTANCAARGIGELPNSLFRRIAENPADFLWQNLVRPVKISHESIIVEAELPLDDHTVRVAYKQFRPRNWWKALCAWFRSSRAFDGWQRGRLLMAHGISTARPIFACRGRGWHSPGTSYLATQWIEGSENLHVWGWRLADCPLAFRLRRAAQCAESLGHLIGRMHAACITHRDLKAANLLVVEEGNQVTTWLVDLDGMRAGNNVSPERRASDLARLAVGLTAHAWVSRTICRRFLRAYATEFPPGTIDWKALWRAIVIHSARNVRRKRRRGQQVL